MKRVFAILLLPFFLLVFVPVVLAQSNFRNDEVSTLSRNETINKDYFATGEKITLSGTVNGDAYLAGGNITVDGLVNGDLLVGGGNINITGEVTGDIRSAGGNIQIDGIVGGNVTTLGGSVIVDEDAQISGSLVAGAGTVEIFGPIGRGITAGAGSLLIGNRVGSDVVAGVGELDLAANAVVEGELNYISEKKATMAEGASVSGRIKHQVPPKDANETDKKNFLAGAAIGWAIFKFLSSLLIGLLLLWAFPNFIQKISETITNKPVPSLGFGFLVLVMTPIVAILLMVTLIGLPLGIILMVGYFFLIYIAKIFAGLALGERILGAKTSRYGALALGLLIISVVWFIPLIGGLVEFIAVLLGLGAYTMTKRSVFQNLRSKKLL